MTLRRIVLLIVVAGLTTAGCQSLSDIPKKIPSKALSGSGSISDDELRVRLNEFAEHFSVMVRGAADTIAAETREVELRQASLRWKIGAIRGCKLAVRHPDARAAFVDTWTFTAQLHAFLEVGAGHGLFEEWQSVALDATRDAEAEVRAIGALFLTPQKLATAAEEVRAFARANPMNADYARRVTLPSEVGASAIAGLEWILEKPLGLSPLGGLDETAVAVREFSEVAESINRTVEALPEQTRWETELLLYDIESRPTVKSLVATTEEISATVAALPARVREELETAVDQIESAQPELQKTLVEARTTTEELRNGMQEAQALVAVLDSTAIHLRDAGESWRQMLLVIDGWVQASDDEPTDQSDDGGGFDITEYERTAEALTRTGAELRGLLSEVREFSSSEELNTQRTETLDETGAALEAVVDHAAWRVAQIIALLFVGAFVYRALSRRFFRSP